MFDFESLKDSGLNVDDHVLKLATALGGVLADGLVTWGLPADKSNALVTAITIITVLLIAGISHVQANKLKAQGAVAAAATKPPETPATQFNVASDVKNSNPTAEDPPQPFTPAQMAAMQQVFSAMLAPHLKPRVPQPPMDHPKGA